SGLGFVAVSGRMRLPRPAAMIMAVCGASAGTSARKRNARLVWLTRLASTVRADAPAPYSRRTTHEQAPDRPVPGRAQADPTSAVGSVGNEVCCRVSKDARRPPEFACSAALRAPNKLVRTLRSGRL